MWIVGYGLKGGWGCGPEKQSAGHTTSNCDCAAVAVPKGVKVQRNDPPPVVALGVQHMPHLPEQPHTASPGS